MMMGDDDTTKESKESKESKKAEDDEDDEDHEYVKEVKEIQGSISNSSGKTTTVKVHRIPTRLWFTEADGISPTYVDNGFQFYTKNWFPAP